MSKTILVDHNLIRYIVPFSFELPKNETFQKFCNKIKEVKVNEKDALWEEYCIGKKECDLYDSVQKTMQCSSSGNQGIGQGYVLNPNCRQKYLPLLKVTLEDNKEVEITIVNLGLNIFGSGIGFVWYELNYKTTDIQEILTISNSLKEFTHNNTKINIFKTVKLGERLAVNEKDINKNVSEIELSDQFLRIDGKSRDYIKKTLLPEDLAGKKDLKLYYRGSELWYKTTQVTEFHFADFILELLVPFQNKKYFSCRDKTVNNEIVSVPDKAILFSVITENGLEGDEILPYLYWLGRGYVDSYFVPKYFLNQPDSFTYEPFKDSIWFAGQEGCAQIICNSDNTKRAAFYDTTYLTRLEDYFYIYLLVLYQYYGLLKYDDEISLLPNEIGGYQKEENRNKLYLYKQKLNFYLMNSVFLGVSHITHHKMFFEYVKKSYDIEQMTSLMMEKITVMNDMVEQWQEKQKNNRYLVISIIGGIFVVIQTFNNIIGIYDLMGLEQWIGKGIFGIMTLLISLLIGLAIWFFVKDKS